MIDNIGGVILKDKQIKVITIKHNYGLAWLQKVTKNMNLEIETQRKKVTPINVNGKLGLWNYENKKQLW